jgi:hypothetical protein
LILFEVSKSRAWKSWFSQDFWIIKLCNIQKSFTGSLNV